MTPTEMPDDVRRAFLKILSYTLTYIRATKHSELVFALSDHAHNIPSLIEHYTAERFRYYWEIERQCFLRAMERIGQPSGRFQESWEVLEKHYKSLEHQNTA